MFGEVISLSGLGVGGGGGRRSKDEVKRVRLITLSNVTNFNTLNSHLNPLMRPTMSFDNEDESNDGDTSSGLWRRACDACRRKKCTLTKAGTTIVV